MIQFLGLKINLGAPYDEIRDQISTKSIIFLSSLIRATRGTRARTMPSKESGTTHSRKNYCTSAIKKQSGNNAALSGFTLSTRNVIVTFCTAHLPSGVTSLCKTIKSGAAKRRPSAATK